MTIGCFADLVFLHFFQGSRIGVRVIFDGDLGCHAAQCMGAAPMTGFDDQKGIGVHAMAGHGNLGTVGKDIARHIFKTLDETEDIIPAAAIQTGHVIFKLVDDFIYFECGQNGFDQNRGLDGSGGNADHFLGSNEDIIPQSGFQMAFNFRQVKIGSGPFGQQGLGIMVKIKSEIKYTA